MNVVRMSVKKSDEIVTAWSVLRLGRTPLSSASCIAGVSCPIAISIAGESETWPPVSLIKRQVFLAVIALGQHL
jgi:hypothetical protein